MKVLKKVGNAYVAQFDCHLRPFVFHIDLDDEADPQVVSLLFEEANEAGVVLCDPISIPLKLEAFTWQEIKPDQKQSWQERTLSQEFFQDKRKTVIHLILDRIKAAKYDEDACLLAFKMPRQDIREGMLVSYTEVMTYGDDDDSPIWFGYDLTFGIQQYLIEDRYCPNPQCDCQKVFFDFYRVSSKPMESICLLQVGFDGQRVKMLRCHQGFESDARAILGQLLAEETELLVECERRYGRVRQATRRMLGRIPLLPKSFLETRVSSKSKIVSLPPQRPSAKVSRNSPCPCGSGKKYKQCCVGRSLGIEVG